MSLWVFGYQAPASNKWLLESGFRFLREDGNFWIME